MSGLKPIESRVLDDDGLYVYLSEDGIQRDDKPRKPNEWPLWALLSEEGRRCLADLDNGNDPA